MSFRDTFTRDSSSSENLQYDDTAAYHFLTTILLLISVPLLYNIFKTILNPFGFMPKLKEIENKPQFTKKIVKFKQENRYKFVTCWFVLKIFVAIFVVFGLAQCYFVLNERGDNMKGFDPYEILEVEPDAPVEKIKKSYRKLALKYHPDRNRDDPEAQAKFIMISKAYECLTDEQAKENCLKFGNPEGTSSFNVGIALPSFLVQKENQVVIMGLVLILVVIILPIFLIYYFGEVNKYDEYGMLQESHGFVNGILQQHLSIKDSVKALAVCTEFKSLKTTKPQVEKLEKLLKESDEDYTKFFLKKNFMNYIKKSIVLIDARVNEKKIPTELVDDLRFIMKKAPVLIKSTIMIAYERSNEMIARFRPDIFVGGNAIGSLIVFGQYFIQGRSLNAEPFEQLDFTEDEIDKIFKKKKKKNLFLNELQANEDEKQFILQLVSPERSKYIEDMISYIPQIVELETIVHAAGDKDMTTMDNIEVIVEMKSNRKSNFCNAVKYPFLKMEGWWLLVLDKNNVVYLEHFSFEKDEKFESKFSRGMYREPGSYSLTVKLFSDCYFGLDIERVVKFTIGQPKKVAETVEPEEKEEEDQSIFDKVMKSFMPQEEEELSDREDEPIVQKKSKSEQVEQKGNSEEEITTGEVKMKSKNK